MRRAAIAVLRPLVVLFSTVGAVLDHLATIIEEKDTDW